MTLSQLIAYIEIWAQPPRGFPSECMLIHHQRYGTMFLYELDSRKGWYYLTAEGEKLKRELPNEQKEEIERWKAHYRGEVEEWAGKTVALLDDIWDGKTQNDSGIIDPWEMDKA